MVAANPAHSASRWATLDSASALQQALQWVDTTQSTNATLRKRAARNPDYRYLTSEEKFGLAEYIAQNDQVNIPRKHVVLANWVLDELYNDIFLKPTGATMGHFRRHQYWHILVDNTHKLVYGECRASWTGFSSETTPVAISHSRHRLSTDYSQAVPVVLAQVFKQLVDEAPTDLVDPSRTVALVPVFRAIEEWFTCLSDTDIPSHARAFLKELAEATTYCCQWLGHLVRASTTATTNQADLRQLLVLAASLLNTLVPLMKDATVDNSNTVRQFNLTSQQLLPAYATVLYWLPQMATIAPQLAPICANLKLEITTAFEIFLFPLGQMVRFEKAVAKVNPLDSTAVSGSKRVRTLDNQGGYQVVLFHQLSSMVLGTQRDLALAALTVMPVLLRQFITRWERSQVQEAAAATQAPKFGKQPLTAAVASSTAESVPFTFFSHFWVIVSQFFQQSIITESGSVGFSRPGSEETTQLSFETLAQFLECFLQENLLGAPGTPQYHEQLGRITPILETTMKVLRWAPGQAHHHSNGGEFQRIGLRLANAYGQVDLSLVAAYLAELAVYAVAPLPAAQSEAMSLLLSTLKVHAQSRQLDVWFDHLIKAIPPGFSRYPVDLARTAKSPVLTEQVLSALMSTINGDLPFALVPTIVTGFGQEITQINDNLRSQATASAKPSSENKAAILALSRSLETLAVLMTYFVTSVGPDSRQQHVRWDNQLGELFTTLVQPLWDGAGEVSSSSSTQETQLLARNSRVFAGLSLHGALFEVSEAYRQRFMVPEALAGLWNTTAGSDVNTLTPQAKTTLLIDSLQMVSYLVSQPHMVLATAPGLTQTALIEAIRQGVDRSLSLVHWKVLEKAIGSEIKTGTASWDRHVFNVNESNEVTAQWFVVAHDYLDLIARYASPEWIPRLLAIITRAAPTPSSTTVTATTDSITQVNHLVLSSAPFYEIPELHPALAHLLIDQLVHHLGTTVRSAAGKSDAHKTTAKALAKWSSVTTKKAPKALAKLVDQLYDPSTAPPSRTTASSATKVVDAWQTLSSHLGAILGMPLDMWTADQARTLLNAVRAAMWTLRGVAGVEVLPAGAGQIWTQNMSYACELAHRLHTRFSLKAEMYEGAVLIRHLVNLVVQPPSGTGNDLSGAESSPAPWSHLTRQAGRLVDMLLSRYISKTSGTEVETAVTTIMDDLMQQMLHSGVFETAPVAGSVAISNPSNPHTCSSLIRMTVAVLHTVQAQVVTMTASQTDSSKPAKPVVKNLQALVLRYANQILKQVGLALNGSIPKRTSNTHGESTFADNSWSAGGLDHRFSFLVSLGHAALRALQQLNAFAKTKPESHLRRLFTMATLALRQIRASYTSSPAKTTQAYLYLDRQLIELLTDFPLRFERAIPGPDHLALRLLGAHVVAHCTTLAGLTMTAAQSGTICHRLFSRTIDACAQSGGNGLRDFLSHLLEKINGTYLEPLQTGSDNNTDNDIDRWAGHKLQAQMQLLLAICRADKPARKALVEHRLAIIQCVTALLQRTNVAEVVLVALHILDSMAANQAIWFDTLTTAAMMQSIHAVASFGHLTRLQTIGSRDGPRSTLKAKATATATTTESQSSDAVIIQQIFAALLVLIRRLLLSRSQWVTPILPSLLNAIGQLFRAFAQPSDADQFWATAQARLEEARFTAATVTVTADTFPSSSISTEVGQFSGSEVLQVDRHRHYTSRPQFGWLIAYAPLPLDQADHLSLLLDRGIGRFALAPANHNQHHPGDRRHLKSTHATQSVALVGKYMPDVLAHYFQIQLSESPIAGAAHRKALQPGLFALLKLMNALERDTLMGELNNAGKTMFKNLYQVYQAEYKYKGDN